MEQQALKYAIEDYIQTRAAAKLEAFDKEAEKKRNNISDDIGLATLNEELGNKRQAEEERFVLNVWLTDAAKRAKQISLVTHALKFTHTDAKGSSIFSSASEELSPYLTSATLKQSEIDVVGNAAALDVAGLLKLEADGTSLIDCIEKNDLSVLLPFANDETQLAEWFDGFNQVLVNQAPASHKLAKQIYFPVISRQYHLLSPLYPSSLSQALYQRIADSRYPEEIKLIRKARKDKKYHPGNTIDYLNTAVQTFGGTKPQNVSQLNSGRGGKGFLLPSLPPTWTAQLRLPTGHKNSFWKEYDRRAWREARGLQIYLVKIVKRTSTKERRDKRARYIDKLIEILFMYAAEIQNATVESGWSASSKITQPEKLWLDPERKDVEFQEEREKNDWQAEIAKQFSVWLNQKLKHEKLDMGDPEYKRWFRDVMDGFKTDLGDLNS